MAHRIVQGWMWMFFLLFLPTWGMGQSMTSTGGGVWGAKMISNFSDCANVNCWHTAPGNAVYVSSRNGATIAVNSANQGFTYTDYLAKNGANTWTYHSEWGAVNEVQKAGDGNYYGLTTAVCGPGYAIGKYVGGSSGWVNVGGGCGMSHDLSVAALGSGLFAVVGTDCHPYISQDYGQHWTLVNGTFCVLSVASFGSDQNIWYAVKADNTIWEITPSGWAQVGNGCCATKIDVDMRGRVYVIGTDNNVYFFDRKGGAWDKLYGTATMISLANGGSGHVWAAGSNGQLYRFSDVGLQWSRTYSGQVNCNIPPPYGQTICATFNHTASLQIQAGGHTSAISHATPWSGSGSWGITATVDVNDIFDCIENPTGPCDVVEVANTTGMQCSGGGSNFDDPLNPIIEFSQDAARWNGPNGGDIFYPPTETINRKWFSEGYCAVSHVGTCSSGETAVCQIKDTYVASGDDDSPAIASAEVRLLCPITSPWATFSWTIANVQGWPCNVLLWEDNAPIPQFCY